MSSAAPSAIREESVAHRLPGLIPLQPAVQHYAWGDPKFIPALLGETNADGRPWAELWMGAHPDAPSGAVLGGSVIPLDGSLPTRRP